MKVAVTGGAGFIGRRVVDRLSALGHEPVVYDREHGADIVHTTFSFDTTIDHVIHLAGVLGTDELFDSPHHAVSVNVMGTVNVLEWCARAQAGFTGILMPDAFKSIYTATKVCSARLASAYHHSRGVPVSHVRAFNAYGPGQAHGDGHPRKIIPAFADEAWHHQPLTVWGDGTQTVDLVHVDDVARMLVDAIRFGDDCTFDAGTGTELEVNTVAELVNEHTGNPSGIAHYPMRRGEPEHTRIRAMGEGWDRLGWCPHFSERGLEDTIRSYQPAVVAA